MRNPILRGSLEQTNFMRLSLKKAAYAAVVRIEQANPGISLVFARCGIRTALHPKVFRSPRKGSKGSWYPTSREKRAGMGPTRTSLMGKILILAAGVILFSAKSLRVPLLCALSALAILSGCKKAQPTLSLLVWEGYADPSFIQGFEAKCQCKVTAAYMGSSDELVAKLWGGASSTYDVISPSSDVATMLSRSGLVAPLDLSKIPNYAQLAPNLTSRPLVKQNGKVYGVPLTWGPNPLLYDTTAFPKAPAAWAELWDPKYANKLSFWDDLSTMYMAAEVLGYGKADPAAVYNLTDAQLEQVKQKLIALKPNIR